MISINADGKISSFSQPEPSIIGETAKGTNGRVLYHDRFKKKDKYAKKSAAATEKNDVPIPICTVCRTAPQKDGRCKSCRHERKLKERTNPNVEYGSDSAESGVDSEYTRRDPSGSSKQKQIQQISAVKMSRSLTPSSRERKRMYCVFST